MESHIFCDVRKLQNEGQNLSKDTTERNIFYNMYNNVELVLVKPKKIEESINMFI